MLFLGVTAFNFLSADFKSILMPRSDDGLILLLLLKFFYRLYSDLSKIQFSLNYNRSVFDNVHLEKWKMVVWYHEYKTRFLLQKNCLVIYQILLAKAEKGCIKSDQWQVNSMWFDLTYIIRKPKLFRWPVTRKIKENCKKYVPWLKMFMASELPDCPGKIRDEWSI